MEGLFIVYPFWVKLHSGGHFGISVNPTYQRLENNFEPLGITIGSGNYRFTRYSLYADSDPSKKISFLWQYDFGPYYNGSLNTTTASLSISPIPQINIKPGLNFNHFMGVGKEAGDRNVALCTLKGSLYLNPRLQLSGLLQYNSQTEVTLLNIRFSWEYSPLSSLYLVYNNNSYDGTERKIAQSYIFKLSYLKQF